MKKTIAIVIVVVIIAIGVVAVIYSQHKKATTVTPGTASITEVDATKSPDNFPKEIPIEQGARIVYNFNAVNAKGQNQATREFVTKGTLKANYDLYKKVLQDNGWSITTDQSPDAEQLLIATKGSNTINIHTYTEVKTLENRVSINNVTAQ